MTRAAKKLIETFQSLPQDDQRAVAVEILRQALVVDQSPLADAELVLAADQVFLDLDRREEQD